ncbi:hypothetical protein CO731_00818 [Aminobacter sp. MSH1]|uniref:hypothetical protein n=1 Tax=Aminobacter sp. MSH1 TaxID=374606 RepID=UPI000D3E6979|nr:hypothetical protein [Aminobacter sp. MSH1]AWC21367.1 hypothetical protein CO731_00818 [Aminobacter sp. MSH1]
MSADNRTPKAKEMSQPLTPSPMPEYEFQRNYDLDRPSYTQKTSDADGRKLDLSGVVFNFN